MTHPNQCPDCKQFHGAHSTTCFSIAAQMQRKFYEPCPICFHPEGHWEWCGSLHPAEVDPDKAHLEARIELLEDDLVSRLSELDKAGERIRWLEAENELLKRKQETTPEN